MNKIHHDKLYLNLIHRLRTGWSVKTGSFESHGWGHYSNSCTSSSNRCGQSYLLTDDERKAIIQVNTHSSNTFYDTFQPSFQFLFRLLFQYKIRNKIRILSDYLISE